MSANVIDTHPTNILNKDLMRNSFSNQAKVASMRPILKKGKRPISILNRFSEVYERFSNDQLTSFAYSFLSKFISENSETLPENNSR